MPNLFPIHFAHFVSFACRNHFSFILKFSFLFLSFKIFVNFSLSSVIGIAICIMWIVEYAHLFHHLFTVKTYDLLLLASLLFSSSSEKQWCVVSFFGPQTFWKSSKSFRNLSKLFDQVIIMIRIHWCAKTKYFYRNSKKTGADDSFGLTRQRLLLWLWK